MHTFIKTLILISSFISSSLFANWNLSFDENSSSLQADNGSVKIAGSFSFSNNGNNWKIADSRDGVKNRLAIVDNKGDVQGYITFPENSNRLEIFFYHRTAQSYKGRLSFNGKISFLSDAFACCSIPQKGERVLQLGVNSPDSAICDSLFSPQSDTMLRIFADSVKLASLGNGSFDFSLSGEISEAAEAHFIFDLQKDFLKNRYVPYYKPLDKKRCPKTPTGWMSWNTYFDKATAEDNLAEARIGKKFLQPFGCEIWSIESWQGNSDQLPVAKFYNMNLETNQNQFPKGMKQLAQDIRALGFRPGIWMAPFGTGNEEFYRQHKDWFLHSPDGKPISSWNGKYTLDPTVPAAREHLRNIFKIAREDWGYEFFKIDGMSGRSKGYCAHLYERPEIRAQFSDPSCPNPFELCVIAFREGIGDDAIFLACQGHTSGPEAAYAEMSRTGADVVHPNMPIQWKNVLNQAKCTVNQIFTHNISMISDPDTILVKYLPIETARVEATIVALPGQLTFFGDRLAGVDSEKMKILQQTLPVADVRPMSIYPHFSMIPVWNLAVRNPVLGDYNVVAFFNWTDEEADISASAKELGICPDKPYDAFEFWTQKYMGQIKLPIAIKVPARGVRIAILRKASPAPQVLATDRHIAQSGFEFKSAKFDSSKNSLEGTISLVGNFPLKMFVSVPKGYSFDRVESTAEASSEVADGVVAITFKGKDSSKNSDCDFKVFFKK